ncbi:hypothetical protein [Bifidobacterium stellenboschense]|uniref:3-methyl-2-oxobutanoate hydroxymethyltransferase n=1 Tax=Bifidobacterium stellenboschense TaxID=762211 RepID=A0A087DMY5_9BIFI|nr:hypothetical protein [Bifidobacterium stellenboschense]KFI96885.1 3-methyl-2-oxobutanoate hydroxymethyltransferase [Bifidobacterium stellenboschense]
MQAKKNPNTGNVGAKDSITILGESFDPNTPGYVLQATTDYLLETAYGLYKLTVTHDAIDTARCLTMCAYASWIAPTSIAFTAKNDDLPALRMLQAATLLCADARTTLTTGPFPKRGHKIIRTGKTDTMIDSVLALGLLPTRNRQDLHYMRQRMAASARRLDYRGGNVLEFIASQAGASWDKTVAALADEWKAAA